MDKLKVETKRMLLQPMSDSEIEEMMAEMHSDDLRAAYGEMLAGYMSAPFCSFTKGRQKGYNLNNRHREYTVRQDRDAQ